MSDIKIFVVGGKANKFPAEDNIRQRFYVDETHDGDNIDSLNPWYCELTGMYYMWKHEIADIVGLEHYRRNFTGKSGLLNDEEIKEILKDHDVILYRMPLKQNAMQHMCGAGKRQELILGLGTLYTKYGKSFSDYFFKNVTGDHVYLGNMFICKKEIADKFFEFIFGILKDFDKIHQFKTPRIDGYIAEYFMEPWFRYNGYKIYDCDRQVLDKTGTRRLQNWA